MIGNSDAVKLLDSKRQETRRRTNRSRRGVTTNPSWRVRSESSFDATSIT